MKDNNNHELALVELASNTIRILAAESVQKANSGHPGMPMGMADCAFVLWNYFLQFNPNDTEWPNRDRFILSPGHGSMLIYSLLHLFGYDLSINDLKNFRQLGSKTPGHPEYGEVKGIETTTGPLGQGMSNGIGMAIAAKMTAERFNTEKYKIFGTHKIYGIVSDGDLMEGVSAEAASLAGHLKLDNIIYLYDDNNITIEGSTELAFSESVELRFKSYGWKTNRVDGHDYTEIMNAINEAKVNQKQPILIICKTTIGRGSPNKKNTSGIHGAPLGPEELNKTKENLGFSLEKEFFIPEKVKDLISKAIKEKIAYYEGWRKEYEAWRKENPDRAAEYDSYQNLRIPSDLEETLISALPEATKATRSLSGSVMQKIAEILPNFVGGSADLKPSTNTYLNDYESIKADNFGGRNFHFGIREHAMGSINNGIALYGLFIPFGSTFLVFSDYMRPAIRLAALMKIQNIFVFTHDSIFVGEDGPTHQPVEHLAALRTIPNLLVLRPADGIETAICWAMALRRKEGPTALLLTRQNVSKIERENGFSHTDVAKGGYLIKKERQNGAQVAILSSGSEVGKAVEAANILENKNIQTRVISVPCKELFDSQPEEYLSELLPDTLKTVVIVEAGISFGWKNYFNIPELQITVEDYGVSGPYKELEREFGLTGELIADKIVKFLG